MLDLVTVGRSLVDLYPVTDGPLVGVTHYEQMVGGSPTNVAVGAARLGMRSAVVGSVGDDPLGSVVLDRLGTAGVDSSMITVVAGARTTLSTCEVIGEGARALIYRGTPSADHRAQLTEAVEQIIAGAPLRWVSGCAVSTSDSRRVVSRAIGLGAPAHRILDVDYRDAYWSSAAAAAEVLREVVPLVDIVVANLEEATIVVGDGHPRELAERLLGLGCATAVIKLGERGTLVVDAGGATEVVPWPVVSVNGLGAGDAFGAALCRALADNVPTPAACEFASAAGALVASRRESSAAMPTYEQIISFMNRSARVA
jgi:5-dehydro-2-deoxygluconokinase